MQQKIEIIITVPDLSLPAALQKNPEIKINLEKINTTGAVIIVAQVLNNLINNMLIEQQQSIDMRNQQIANTNLKTIN